MSISGELDNVTVTVTVTLKVRKEGDTGYGIRVRVYVAHMCRGIIILILRLLHRMCCRADGRPTAVDLDRKQDAKAQ